MKDLLKKLGTNFLGVKTAKTLLILTWLAVVLLHVVSPLLYVAVGNVGFVLHLALVILTYWPLRNVAHDIDSRLPKGKEE